MSVTPDLVTIHVDLPGVTDYTENEKVGPIYEVGINGVGFMLADHPEKGIAWKRGTIELAPQRLATSETPFSQSIERYNFDPKMADWSGGAGQRYANRERSTADRFWDGENINPFKQAGELTLLHEVDALDADTAVKQAVIVGSNLYYVNGAASLGRFSTPTTAESDITTIADTTGTVPSMNSLTSDGQYWYAATTRSVIRGTTSSPGADWSAQDAYQVEWAAGRIMAAVETGSGSTPNVFTSLAKDGTEENTGGHLTLDDGQTILLGKGTDQGHYFFGAYAGSVGRVYAWQLGLDESSAFFVPFVAWDMPDGMVPRAVFSYSGSVFIRAWEPSSDKVVIYRAVHDGSGFLAPDVVVELAGSGNEKGTFGVVGDNVLFSWQSMAESGVYSGVGAVSLVSGGYSKWLYAAHANTDNDEPAVSIGSWNGRTFLAHEGGGIFLEDNVDYKTTGWVESSIADGASVLSKVFDDVDVVMNPLLASQSIVVAYSLNGGGSYVTAGTLSDVSLARASVDVGKKGPDIALKLTLVGTAAAAPVLRFAQGRYHALGLADTILVLPIACDDVLSDVKGSPLPDNGQGKGTERARLLEGLSQTRVSVQDIDWPTSGIVDIYEVVGVESQAVGIFDRSVNHKVWSMVTQVTLRKEGSG